MTAQTGDRLAGERRRWTVLSDGGETLCVACGEAHTASSDACPACGYRPTANGTTDDQDSGSTGDGGSGASAIGGPNVLDGEDSSADSRSAGTSTTRTHTAGGRPEDAASAAKVSSSDHGRSEPNATGRSGTGKSPLVAAVLSFILIGAGHVYIGEIKRGVGVFLGAIGVSFVAVLTLGLGTPLILVVWGWAMYDAYKRAA